MTGRLKEPVRYLTLFEFAGMAVFLTGCLMHVLMVMRGRRMVSRCRQHADEEQIASGTNLFSAAALRYRRMTVAPPASLKGLSTSSPLLSLVAESTLR